MKEPVDHVLRPPLPWRDEAAVTECGYNAASVKTISREQFFERKRSLGQQRCALMTCMTCSDTATRWTAWAEDPRMALQREIIWERGEWYRARTERGERLKDELFAIEQLIADHRAQFEAMIEFRKQRRAWNEQKQARKPPEKP